MYTLPFLFEAYEGFISPFFLQELQNSAAAAAKIAEKIEKVKSTGCELKQGKTRD